ncbi:MAG: tRNA 5-methoxyuridine(34)/uridine 5-oxyacetic acid(34) synthase CmoB [Gammaproteobacteria bacterium]|jgi:tRNA (mo5U34)-methyltransferase|nr:tRNA 5-methoxyuridine(34)/uridine 5-oxyacetic acid(34) synthase CmoB [Gammaproteobacteria bacterium]
MAALLQFRFDSRDPMIDQKALSAAFSAIGVDHWRDALLPLIDTRLSAAGHGDFERWQKIVSALADVPESERRELLLSLAPWRKGPLNLGGIAIDTEWRSDWKWSRVKDAIEPLAGRKVLDVGCGNGYFALQMAKAGADYVIGVDPTIVFVMQFLAINHFERNERVFVVPARMHELPLPARRFDTTFSMGVLYHCRSPIDHLQELRQTLRPGGQLILETLFLPGDEAFARTPTDRYARMRNVWMLPTIKELEVWMARSGYRNFNVVDQTLTTTDEQRSTEWMTFESLRESLDPEDPGRTVEGWPAPRRVVVTATSP